MTTKKAPKKKKAVKKRKLTKKKNELIAIQSPVNPDMQVVIASERFDDEIIEREMMGDVMPFFIYQFQQDGKDVVGLTVKGTNEVVRRLAIDPRSRSKIRINPEYIKKEEVEREGQKGIEVTVFAEDLVTGNSAFGVKFEPYMKSGRNGTYRNKFAVEKALSKAERNAKRKLIPEVLATKVIQKIIKGEPDSVKSLDAPSTETVIKVPAKIKPSTPEELFDVVLSAIDKIKDIGKVIEFDERASKDGRFSKEQREQIHLKAVARVNELEDEKK